MMFFEEKRVLNTATDSSLPKAVVIGGGIIGACSAYALLRRGFSVSLIEKDMPGHAASFGNSGSIGLASVPPLGMPGMLKQVPNMLLDPMHPLVVRWRHLPTAAPWLLRFTRSMAPDRVEAITRARATLLQHAGTAYQSLLAEIGRPELIHGGGLIFAYETEAALAGAQGGIALRRRHGIEAHEMSGAQLRELEPAISDRAVGGVYYPVVQTVTNPLDLTQAILGAFVAQGGQVHREEVRGLETGPAGVHHVVTNAGRHPSDLVVLAAGAWTGRLARMLGETIPVIAERGYHVMISEPTMAPTIPVVSGDRHVSITTMSNGLRMTTMAEFADIDAPPDHARALRVFEGATGLIRNLELKVASRWMGARPSTPDSLPVIGRSSRHRNVIHASGHGHLGLTFGAITASIVANLARDETPNLDILPYSPTRHFDGSDLVQALPSSTRGAA
jgi:D-amino-acid dehydrogenase